jgi:hypothetical protein
MNNAFLTALVLGGAAWAYVTLGSKATAAQRLTANVKNIKNAKISLGQTTVMLTIAVNNPTGTNLRCDSVEGSLINGGNVIGTFNSKVGVVLPANKNVDLDVSVTLSHLGLAQQLYSIFTNKSLDKTATIKGTLTLQGGNIVLPFENNIKLA